MWKWGVELNLEEKKFPDWKDLKVNIIEVNAFEDKEIEIEPTYLCTKRIEIIEICLNQANQVKYKRPGNIKII